MSLALAMSANLNRDLCANMAVSSNIQAVASTPSVHHQKPIHVHEGEHCCGLPYQDHNYGAPPPPPTPPLSPSEPCFKPMIPQHNEMCINSCPPTVSPPPSVPTHLPYQNGLVNTHTNRNGGLLFPNNFNETALDITRCICGFTHDDGYMICCDNCSVWQHIDCMRIDRNNIPDTYLCDRCNPRQVNQEEAIALQSKKREDLSMTSDLDSSGVDSCDERSNLQAGRVQYTSVQSTPTSLTITSNRMLKRYLSNLGSNRKRKRSRDDARKTGNKRLQIGDKKPRSRPRSKSTHEAGTDIDILPYGFSWEKKLREWSESYHELEANQYTPEMLQAVLSASNKLNGKTQENGILNKLQTQLNKVQQLKHRVMAMEDICVSMPIVELRGRYMLSNQFEGHNTTFYKRPYPYMFFYTGFDGLQICVDARESGNVARFMRRSCQPNSELKHIMENNKLHLYVFSKQNISCGSEITIPFDFNYQNCFYNVECGCSCYNLCPVYKFTSLRRELDNRNGLHNEDRKISPLILSLSRVSQNLNGYTSSEHEHTETEDGKSENLRKKSREERKMEAYIRAFEKMEKQEKKKELHHHQHSPLIKVDVTPTFKDPIQSPTYDESTSTQTTTPFRRINRRRSNRGGRRNSRRGRGPSFEGVMSPGVSMETDSNHSFDGSISGTIAPERFASIDSEQSGASSGQLGSSDIIDESTQYSLLGNEVASILDNVSTDSHGDNHEKHKANVPTGEWRTTSQSNSVHQEDSESTVTANVKKDGAAAPVSSENLQKETVTATINSVSSSSCSVVTKSSKPKKNGSTDGTLAIPSTSSSRVSTPTAPCIHVRPVCSFIPWEYRPGIPSGHVHIGVGATYHPNNRPEKAEKFLKKHWLEKAVKENLVPDGDPVQYHAAAKPNSVAAHKFFKKRILKAYSTEDAEATNTSQMGEQSKPEICANDTEKPDDETPETVVHSKELPPESCQESTVEQALVEPILPVTPSMLLCPKDNPLPVLEYENLSDDEDTSDISQPADACIMDNAATCIESKNFSSMTPIHSWLSSDPSSDPANRIYSKEQLLLQPMFVQQQAEEAQIAPTKKKVSLQEYLKRSKDVRKHSTETVSIKTSTSISENETSKTVVAAKTTTPTIKPIPSLVKKQESPKAVISPKQIRTKTGERHQKHSNINNRDVEHISKCIKEAAKTLTPQNNNDIDSKLNDLSSVLSTETIKTLPPEVMEIITKTVKQFHPTPEEEAEPPPTNKVSSLPGVETNGLAQKFTHRHSPASVASRSPQEAKVKSPSTPVKLNPQKAPLYHRPRSGSGTADPQRKHHLHLTHGKPSSTQASPVMAPRSPRVISSLRSPSTPTIYDHRREHGALKKADSNHGGVRSRHNSGTSSGSGSTLSTRSPHSDHHVVIKQHSGGQSTLGNHKQDPHRRGSISEPQKVPSLAPAVPGQPIPSLARGPGGPGSLTTYNSRLPSTSSRPLSSPPPWDDYAPPSRSRKDPPYSRTYYQPGPLPEHVSSGYRRSSYDKPQHYDRYLSYPPRREETRDDYPATLSKHSPPSSYYHHNSSSYYPGHSEGKTSYFPPRDPPPRPVSPGPPPRHGPTDYYPKRKGEPFYRPSYYTPDLHRR